MNPWGTPALTGYSCEDFPKFYPTQLIVWIYIDQFVVLNLSAFSHRKESMRVFLFNILINVRLWLLPRFSETLKKVEHGQK